MTRKKLEEVVQVFDRYDRSLKQAQDRLPADRTAFAKEKQDWYAEWARKQELHKEKMAAELEEHNARMAAAERAIQ